MAFPDSVERIRVTTIFAAFYASLLAAAAIPVIQGFFWLRSGVWPSFSVAQLYERLGAPVIAPANTSWVGVNLIVEWFYSAHASIGAVAVGIAAVAAIRLFFYSIDLF